MNKFLSKFAFSHRVYVITGLLVAAFLFFIVNSQLQLQKLAENITLLKEQNISLQEDLMLVNSVERLAAQVYEYTVSGSSDLSYAIEKQFAEILAEKEAKLSRVQYASDYENLFAHLQKYQQSYQLAKEQIPFSFELREKLRQRAEEVENSVGKLQGNDASSDESLTFILIRKSLLETEKSVIRFLETDNQSYIGKARKSIQQTYQHFAFLQQQVSLGVAQQQQIQTQLDELKGIANQTIEHYRTYNMLTQVLMPGDIYEVKYYAAKIRKSTLTEIDQVSNQIQTYFEQSELNNYAIGSVFAIVVIIAFMLLLQVVLEPVKELTVMFEKLADGDDSVEIPKQQRKDEIGSLIRSADRYKQVNRHTKELLKKTQDYQHNLEAKVEEEIEIRRAREKDLIQQSKLASMGEMIGAIAHQWRQPLNELGIRIQKLKFSYRDNKIDEAFINDFISKNRATIEFMSKTIDDFRNFFRIDKQKTTFGVKHAIEDVLSIQSSQLKTHFIEVDLQGDEFSILGYKSEFQQVIMNMVNNAKDALVDNAITAPKIYITLQDNEILISDNAGGVSQEVLERMFEPYFTTKDEGKGTGMGLYMSKMIIEDNMGGKISAQNQDQGLLLTITL